MLHDRGIRLSRCGRAGHPDGQGRQARAGDARVPVGVRPEADGLRAAVQRLGAGGARRQRDAAPATATRVDITAINGIPIAGHQGPGSIADTTVRKLLDAAGPRRGRCGSSSLLSYPGSDDRAREPARERRDPRRFSAPGGAVARAAGARLGADAERVDQARSRASARSPTRPWPARPRRRRSPTSPTQRTGRRAADGNG